MATDLKSIVSHLGAALSSLRHYMKSSEDKYTEFVETCIQVFFCAKAPYFFVPKSKTTPSHVILIIPMFIQLFAKLSNSWPSDDDKVDVRFVETVNFLKKFCGKANFLVQPSPSFKFAPELLDIFRKDYGIFIPNGFKHNSPFYLQAFPYQLMVFDPKPFTNWLRQHWRSVKSVTPASVDILRKIPLIHQYFLTKKCFEHELSFSKKSWSRADTHSSHTIFRELGLSDFKHPETPSKQSVSGFTLPVPVTPVKHRVMGLSFNSPAQLSQVSSLASIYKFGDLGATGKLFHPYSPASKASVRSLRDRADGISLSERGSILNSPAWNPKKRLRPSTPGPAKWTDVNFDNVDFSWKKK